MDTRRRRAILTGLLESAVAAVDPEPLTGEAVNSGRDQPVTLIAIGKAATAMCRGAARVLGEVEGVCVTDDEDLVPDGVELIIGDHPVPGERSFAAGRRVIEVASGATGRIVALISGGGSALCEHPIDGLEPEFIRTVHSRLVSSGASIEEINLVRRHLSALKNGGLARAASVPVDSYLISDVCEADPSVIASGPTIYQRRDPESALAVLAEHGIDVSTVRPTIMQAGGALQQRGTVEVIADGHTAVDGLVQAADAAGVTATAADGWLKGDITAALDRFLDNAGPGLTVATGEPEVAVTGAGRGGRNTHAATLAAGRIAGTDALFAAFATDGVDGSSGSAGGIVDGTTVERGGDPSDALQRSDSATYLEAAGDLLPAGPTGTNVSDLWVLWR